MHNLILWFPDCNC